MTLHPTKSEETPVAATDSLIVTLRTRALRGDERGSVTLLAGMMVFLATIFGVIAFDTNMAIYNRIVAQNAVDSAADAAVLWQARGCNMLQQLNNLHYDVDVALCIAEGVSAGACVASAALLAAEIAADVFFGAGEALRPIRIGTCFVCDPLPWIDYAQQLFYEAIMPIEQAIVDVIPYVSFGYANACAKGSGADTLLVAFADAGQSFLAGFGINLPSVGSLGPLGSIPIYAAPLDPDSFGLFDPQNKGLYVKRRKNDGSPPLKWPEAVGIAGEAAGYIGCEDAEPAPPFAESMSQAEGTSWDKKFGWDDEYFFGHPGFNTWIAGKAKHKELLAMGNLRWLNGGNPVAEMDYSWMRQRGPAMYNGSVVGGGQTLEIPGFIAIASSQVEGTPVIAHGDVDAKGKLIKVYLPGNSPKSVENFFIYH